MIYLVRFLSLFKIYCFDIKYYSITVNNLEEYEKVLLIYKYYAKQRKDFNKYDMIAQQLIIASNDLIYPMNLRFDLSFMGMNIPNDIIKYCFCKISYDAFINQFLYKNHEKH